MSAEFHPDEAFLHEAEELLTDIELAALSLVAGTQTGETVHQLFRAFHTLKGSGAMFGFERVARFTHHVETLLDRVRDGAVPISEKLVQLVLQARDHIRLLLHIDRGAPDAAEESDEALLRLVEELMSAPAETPAAGEAGEPPVWRIRFHPHSSWLAYGGNPGALLKELENLGECTVTAHTEGVPPLEAIEPDGCYLHWTILLRGATDETAIRDVFLFVPDGSRVEVEPVSGESAMPAAAPGREAAGGDAAVRIPNGARQQVVLARESTVRVPAGRLDRLVNLVGELVMNQARLAQAARQNGGPEFVNPIQELQRLVAELRDDVLGILMLPIGSLFARFRRLVHDLSMELGKEVELVTEGAETELDKSILDQLGEPLVHCLRNCLDHAIEPPGERVGSGKPRHGTIRLAAVHAGPFVVISIQDDGRGIDRAAVVAKAREKQLIGADAQPGEREIFNLILMPGFSTARQVTSVSGRGVGMDAVKRQIDALRGTLSIESAPSAGTRVSITVPLTLAIIDGLLVQVGPDRFIVPLSAVTENVELPHAERERNNRRNVIAVRGELIPYIDLRETFRIQAKAPAIEKVVIVQHEDTRVGLVVDRVLGTHQTVIQSLGRHLSGIEVVSGATIMGDGRVALIMDISAVVRFADRDCRLLAARHRIGEIQPAAY